MRSFLLCTAPQNAAAIRVAFGSQCRATLLTGFFPPVHICGAMTITPSSVPLPCISATKLIIVGGEKKRRGRRVHFTLHDSPRGRKLFGYTSRRQIWMVINCELAFMTVDERADIFLGKFARLGY